MGFSQFVGKVKFTTKKHSPEILFVFGCASMIATVVTACRATIKSEEIFDKRRERLLKHEVICQKAKNGEITDYTEEDAKKDLIGINGKCILSIAKNYALPVGLGILSVTCFAGSMGIYKKWFMGASTAFAALKNKSDNFEKAVREKYGDEAIDKIQRETKEKEIEKEIEEKGSDLGAADGTTIDKISRKFDISNPNFIRGDYQANQTFLWQKQNWLNQKLQANGYLFLNDVYDDLDYKMTKAGQVLGWKAKKPDGRDNYIDFGLRDPINTYNDHTSGVIYLSFNVDGIILDEVGLSSY